MINEERGGCGLRMDFALNEIRLNSFAHGCAIVRLCIDMVWEEMVQKASVLRVAICVDR